jgi:AbrB family looped-hinge helix DNA binding protein
MQASKLSSKGQITIPREIREKLGLEPGHLVAYLVRDGEVVLKRVEPFDLAFHAAVSKTLDEWNSLEDEEAFNDL